MFRRLFFFRAESEAVRLRHSGHMLPASEVGMVSAAESDEVCSVDFLEEGLFFFSGSGRVSVASGMSHHELTQTAVSYNSHFLTKQKQIQVWQLQCLSGIYE